MLRAADVLSLAVPLHRPHDAVETDWADGEEEVEELEALLLSLVDVLLAAALHAVLRLSLLAVEVVTWRSLVQLVAHL